MNKIFQRKIVNIFLRISYNICFACSKVPSSSDSPFEYPQHMFWLRNKGKNFVCTLRPDIIFCRETQKTLMRWF